MEKLEIYTKDLQILYLDEKTNTYLHLLHKFLVPSDSVLEFNDDGCSTSCLFNDIIVHEGKSRHAVITTEDNTMACLRNIKTTHSKILLNSTEHDLPSAIVLGYEAPEKIQDEIVELCTSLETLRLVVLHTDTESVSFLQRLHTVLTTKNFFVHVAGKYTVYVHDKKPEKIIRIPKTPNPGQTIIAVALIVFLILAYFALRSLFFK
jgi:hypothetical protein